MKFILAYRMRVGSVNRLVSQSLFFYFVAGFFGAKIKLAGEMASKMSKLPK
jgi:hypothetical protein